MELMRVFNLIIMFFSLIIIGAIAKKAKIITEEGKKALTDIAVNVILPFNILSSFLADFEKEVLLVGLQMMIISAVVLTLCMLISKFAYAKYPSDKRAVLKYATVFSNAGFLGNVVAEELFGPIGLLYASFYIIPQRIFLWSVGISYFSGMPSKKELVKKIVKHPCIIATVIGIFIMIAQINLPIAVVNTINKVGDCTTAITMMIIGAIVADTDIRKIISKDTILYSIIRLIVIPTFVLIVCLTLNIEATATGVAVMLAGMPAASTTAIMAAKYNGNELFAANCVVLTTFLTIFFIPIWIFILSISS